MNKTVIRFTVGAALLLGAQVALAQQGDAKAGGEIFNKTCTVCHGPDGNAPKQAVATLLKATVPQLGSSEIQAKSDDDVKKALTQGFGKMKPPVPALSDKDVRNVIAYFRTLKKP